MTDMTLVPTHWYSWDFDLSDGDRRLARVEMSSWRVKGVLEIDGINHEVYREGVMSGDFILKRDGLVLATASKPSAFRKAITLAYNGHEYTLRKPSFGSLAWAVYEGETELGSVARAHWWRRDANVALPENWPLHIRVFVIWLALLLWKREADSAGGA